MKPDEKLGIERENSMTPDDRIAKLEKTVEEHSEKITNIEKQQMKDTYDLKTMIVDAVNQSIKPLITKIEEQGKDQRLINEAQDKRITALENAEAQKALKNNQDLWKLVKTIIITAVITLMVNNALDILIYKKTNKENNSEVGINEIYKNYNETI